MNDLPELLRRAKEYCDREGRILDSPLGSGVHGSVFVVTNQIEKDRTAIKVHARERDYCRERDVYLRLMEWEVRAVRDCAVPQLLRHDDELWIIEMTIVTRPFVLDFAGAYLDEPPDHSEDVLDYWREEKREQFGSRWPEVQAILRDLENYGVFMADVNPGNISFGD